MGHVELKEKTVNVRIYKSTHERLKKLASNQRQDLIVVIDELSINTS